MKVRELDIQDVDAAIADIAQGINRAANRPACLIGIANGGVIPAQLLARELGGVPLLTVRLSRKSSGPFKRVLVRLTSYLPTPFRNTLRVWEMQVRTSHSQVPPQPSKSLLASAAKLSAEIPLNSDDPIVIVDDAIDTGKTVYLLVEALCSAGVSRERIKVAVLAHTLQDPLIRADFYAFDGALYRWPWSDDRREQL